MLAAFLNAKLFGNFKGKKEDKFKQAKAAPVRSELQIARVDVPTGLPKTTLRDALLQYRLRHTQHPHEAEAVDWILGQLDPAFELIAVKVPEQTRLLILEAIIQHVQQHAELQLDAGHTARVLTTLQQLTPRFHGVPVELPDDGVHTEKQESL